MNRRSFLYCLGFAVFVIFVETVIAPLNPTGLRRVYRRKQDGSYERIRLFQARRHDILIVKSANDDWPNKTPWLVETDPVFHWDEKRWGVNAYPIETEEQLAYSLRHYPSQL